MATKASEPESQAPLEVMHTSRSISKLLLGGLPIVVLAALVAIILATLSGSRPDSAVLAKQAQSGPDSAGTTGTKGGALPVGPMIGYLAPDFTLNNLEGQPVSLHDFRDKPVVVYFWIFT